MTFCLSNEQMLSLARFICRTRGTQSEDEQFVAQIHRFMLRSCRLIFWHDRRVAWPKEIRGGSGFVLRFGQRLIGVTAAHVVETYRAAVSQTPSLVVQLDNAEFDLLGALIDEDEELDLATFAVAQHQLTPEAAIFDCSTQWPPPDPERGKPVSLIGFPEVLRRPVGRDMSATFGAYGAFALVEDCTDREIIIVYDPSKEQPLAGTKELPPPRFNMSGCSGGPVILHEFRNGLFRWYPVGIINRSPRGGDFGIDIIRVRRLNLLAPDGTINHSTAGWLPTPPP